jgi:prephenate dehydrogenase
MELERVTIIGLGLIGGSLARALRSKTAISEIIAVDSDASSLGLALEQGIIDKGLAVPDSGVCSSDIIFICTPVKQAIEYIDMLAGKTGDRTIVTDVCSTKSEIMENVEKLREALCFIGGHPMAGTERSGFKNSFAHLFENAYYILTPAAHASQESVKILSSVVESIGAIPLVMTAEEHDMAAAGISHLPHVLAAALVNLVKQADRGSGRMQTLAAGGFRDITRIASSNPGLWESIVLSNKKQVLSLLRQFDKILDEFAQYLEDGCSNEIYNFFSEAGRFRDTVSDHGQGLLPAIHKLIVDVQDKPGIIGEIATILGHNNINIKNINVANSREFEQGCLIITFSDTESVNIAFDLLLQTGYKVFKNR